MIEIKNVTKSYNKKDVIINNLNLKINDGEIFGFLGPNGAGKTTTIKMITGILGIDDGDILIDNVSIKDNPIEAKKKFGLVLDNPDIFLKLKGIEYLNFMADIYGVDNNAKRTHIERWAQEFEIYDNLNDRIQTYSHGMRQKICIIASTMHNPNNIILDEPMVGLDPKSSHKLKELMHEYANQGKCFFFSTHVLEVAEKLCDRVGIINNGKLLFNGSVGDVSLEELFLDMTEE